MGLGRVRLGSPSFQLLNEALVGPTPSLQTGPHWAITPPHSKAGTHPRPRHYAVGLSGCWLASGLSRLAPLPSPAASRGGPFPFWFIGV